MKRRLLATLAILIGLVLVGSYAGYQRSLNRKLRENLRTAIEVALDDIRSEGLPVTPEEFATWVTKPPLAENAADLICEATNYFHGPVSQSQGRERRRGDWAETEDREVRLPIVGSGKLPPCTEPLSNAVVRAADELLATNSESLALLHRASEIKTCRFAIDWTPLCGVRLPHLSNVKWGTQLLQLEALLRFEEGHTGQAVESLQASFGVARSLAQEPAVISQFIRLRCNLQAIDVLERLLTRSSISRLDADKLVDDLIGAEDIDGLTRAYILERVCAIQGYRQLQAAHVSWRAVLRDLHNASWSELRFYPRLLWQEHRYRTGGLAELDFLAALEMRSVCIRMSRLPFPQRVTAVRQLKLSEETLSQKQMSFLPMPASTVAMMKHARYVAVLRTARAALVVEQYRADGEPPETLPLAPADPFTGEPLLYKKLTKGYVVYSVGEDGEDNGGAEKNAQGRSYGPGTDITFTVER